MILKKIVQIVVFSVFALVMLPLAGCQRNEGPDQGEKSASTTEVIVRIVEGMTEQELIEAIGEPKGVISGGSRKTLMYDGVQIQTENGLVVNVPEDIDSLLEAGREAREKKDAYIERQKRKGLVYFDGRWMKPKEKEGLLQTKRSPESIQKNNPVAANRNTAFQFNGKDGRPVDHSRYIRRGQITVVDFYADWCGPCRTLAPKLDQLIRSQSGVSLQKVNIGTWGSSVAETYNVTSVPNVRVFDCDGNMIGPPTSSISTIESYIRKAKKQ